MELTTKKEQQVLEKKAETKKPKKIKARRTKREKESENGNENRNATAAGHRAREGEECDNFCTWTALIKNN